MIYCVIDIIRKLFTDFKWHTITP